MHNPNQDPLQSAHRISDTARDVIVPSERTRARVRDELSHRKISQRVAAERLTQMTGELWTQSKVHKILTGQVQLLYDDVALFARLLDLSFAELAREPGREFVADLTPTELAVIESLRDGPKNRGQLWLELFGHAERRKPGRRTIRERMRRKE